RALHGRGDRLRIETLSAPAVILVEDAALKTPTSYREPPGNAMHDQFRPVHSEVEQRFTAIVVAHKDGRKLLMRIEAQASVYPIAPRRYGLELGAAVISVIEIAWARLRRASQFVLHRRLILIHVPRWIDEPEYVDHIAESAIGAPLTARVVEMVCAP